ncbi:lipoyl synthase [Leptospira sp. GIMC2001]|uniref:lipoyl synthase n=1 Tax=Leptospira sp. GIMC2001 TaxID=1513297 RepID=UPI00234BDA00|nr:lipoyl synthase [Leptospira sp. GIMC2001]WCL50920.1 lipoyl synthase [Leptospira sp. GIMC2001]
MNPLKKKARTKSVTPVPDKPNWMKVNLKFPTPNDAVSLVRENVSKGSIHTVCESASCPNLNHCWSRKTATYMIGGDICTRRCKYCDVAFGKPLKLDENEPVDVAESALSLGLRHVVVTSVNRDDLGDGGAEHFARTVEEIRLRLPNCRIEILVPDFKAKRESLDRIYQSRPDIFNHNIETVERLFADITPAKNYNRSMEVLKDAHEHGFRTKSGIILGLGEEEHEVYEALNDLRKNGVSMITIGQYLQPTETHFPIQRYLSPQEFNKYGKYAREIGFLSVASGPLIRSSYHADEQIEQLAD